MYDFANSAFTTLVVTFVYATYFTKQMVLGPDGAPDETLGTFYWSNAVSVTALAVAFASPFVGALADRGGYRREFLLAATVLCVLATAALFGFTPGQATLALAAFVVANVAFEMGNVFYNAYLPEIAPPDRIGRISGYGWGLGYLGGLLCLVLALFGFIQTETPLFGLSAANGENVRATMLLTATWVAVFSVPFFLFVRDDQPARSTAGQPVLASTWRELRRTVAEIRRYRQIVRLLLARLFYNDGLVTIFAMGGTYAAVTFGFTFSQVIVFGIVINLAAGLGALAMGRLDDAIGGKRTLLLSLVGLAAATLLTVLFESESALWAAGIAIGIFAGPNQSASRSLMGRFIPPDKETEFYGFFALSGKLTAFIGPMLFGWLTLATGTQRAGIAAVLVLFLIGGVLLLLVDEREGTLASGRVSRPVS
jgi:UMF1 family MFS transporter